MFRNAKVGDRVWDFVYGWGTIIHIFYEKEYPITFKSDTNRICNFRFDGKRNINDINPSLFWNEIKFEIPINLENELRNLEVKEFIEDKKNFYLVWHSNKNNIFCEYRSYAQQPLGKYFTEESIKIFMDNIKDKNITKEQFFTAYKKVFNNLI